jgi:ferredoxin
MRISIDEAVCTGHGRCYALAPELIEPDDVGHAVVRAPHISDGLIPAARAAVRNCPERAVVLVDDGRT